MKKYLIEFLKDIGIEPNFIAMSISILLIIAITSIVIHLVLHKIILKAIKKLDLKKRNIITTSLLEENFFQGLVVYWQATIWVEKGTIYETLLTISLVWITIFGLLAIYSLIDKTFKTLHAATEVQFFAMRTIIQSIKLIFGIIALIYIIAILADKSPVAILSGLGAMSAVLMLVFKDTILGFTAGLQLSTNKMVQIGDWIEMPKYGADGDVIDIGLNVVKVRNFDKTITTIPTYALVSDSFKNYRGMRESGGRRIKRAYILTYLKNHPNINKDMTIMVRQLAPDEYGIPLEIYCFTSTTVWADYENIQSDIFDHIYSVLQEFDIKPYQYG